MKAENRELKVALKDLQTNSQAEAEVDYDVQQENLGGKPT